MKQYKTCEIAKIVCVHPNTVRLYEKWGLLHKVPRNNKGYRLYTQSHLNQMRLARIALRCDFVEGEIRKKAVTIVKTAAQGKIKKALLLVDDYKNHILKTLEKAEEALELAFCILNGNLIHISKNYMNRKEVADSLEVSIDVLRNWERNGLINISRHPKNNYRIYGDYEIRRLKVIKVLRDANYSMMSILGMFKMMDKKASGDLKAIIDCSCSEENIVSATDRWISTLNESLINVGEIREQLKAMLIFQNNN